MFKRFAFTAVLIAVLAAGVPAVALLGPIAKPVVDPKIATMLADSVTADVIVGFRSAPTDADIASLRKVGFTGPFVRYSIVPAVAATLNASALKAVLSNPRVARVEFDEVLSYTLDRATTVVRSKPLLDATYQTLAGVNTTGIKGRGVTVAVVDSGIDGRHPDIRSKELRAAGGPWVLKGNFVMAGRTNGNEAANILDPATFGPGSDVNDIFEANATAIPAPMSDNGGHGTHVAGTVAGRGVASNGKYKGVAPAANLVGLSVGEVLNVSRGLAAFDWIHNNHAKYGIKVTTNSWGGAGSVALEDSLTYAAVNRLIGDGITVLFSAGNDGGDGTTIETSANCNIPAVICVANYYDRTGYLDTSSSRGLKTDPNTWPDLAAPGTQIISTAMLGGPVTYVGTAQDALISQLDASGEPVVVPAPLPDTTVTEANGSNIVVGDYSSMTGTSMATPVVAGVVALLLEANPNLTPLQVKAILRNTATMLPGRSIATDGFELGAGLVDAAEAVAVALKMRDGESMVDALAHASIDLTTSPALLNFGAGPVTDQTIPLYPGAPSPVTATGHVYQGGAIDVFGLTGQQQMVAGVPVDLAARSIHSSAPSIVLDATNFTVTFFVIKKNIVVGQYDAVIAADEADWQATAAVDPRWEGNLRIVGELTHGANVYRLFDIPVTATRP